MFFYLLRFIVIVFLSLNIGSCFRNGKNFNADSASEKKINLIKREIERLKNENLKMKQVVEIEKNNGIEALTIKNKIEQNELLIEKYKLLIKREKTFSESNEKN